MAASDQPSSRLNDLGFTDIEYLKFYRNVNYKFTHPAQKILISQQKAQNKHFS